MGRILSILVVSSVSDSKKIPTHPHEQRLPIFVFS